jgi:outer membrane receptor protein involved in Fe transport
LLIEVKITSLNLKGTYTFTKNWTLTCGYAYQKYDYSDDQFNGYVNTLPYPGVTTNAAQSYLNGWNAHIPYNANIFYLYGSYKF